MNAQSAREIANDGLQVKLDEFRKTETMKNIYSAIHEKAIEGNFSTYIELRDFRKKTLVIEALKDYGFEVDPDVNGFCVSWHPEQEE